MGQLMTQDLPEPISFINFNPTLDDIIFCHFSTPLRKLQQKETRRPILEPPGQNESFPPREEKPR
jgi:hypothetical protein